MRRMSALLILAFVVAVPLFAQTEVGEVSFANSGTPEAQQAFLTGLALLHNFEYDSAAENFRKAEAIDPSFAMAYWGEAMTFNHPIWFQQDLPAAQAALKKLAATPEERQAKAKTGRERDYLRAVEVLYGTGSKEERDFKYSDAMAALHAKYPDDSDATAFYALSLLGTAHQGRDVRTYMLSAALLEEVFPTHQNHPGVLHYLIHSYDDPIHAPLGMRAARLYGKVAPNAGHALHMTSHIFTALGMWDDVIDANLRAIDVVNRQRSAAGKPAAKCGHYLDWLNYAYLQEGRPDDALKVVSGCRERAVPDQQKLALEPDRQASINVDSWASMRAYFTIDSGRTPLESAKLPDGPYIAPQYTLLYADALSASSKKELPTLRALATELRQKQPALLAWIDRQQESGPSDRIRPKVIQQQVDALVLLREGKSDSGLEALRKAAEMETGMPMEFGPPFVEKPSWELLGEELLAAGKPADAETAFTAALDRAPGRTASLRGLLKAQTALGKAEAAAVTKARLDGNLHAN